MSDSTFITRVVLENYKSIAACDVALGPLTFLVGPNGAGKSNFLDALRFVRDGLADSLDHAFLLRGSNVLRHHAGKSATLGLQFTMTLPSGGQSTYTIRIKHDADVSATERWRVVQEECCVTPAAGEGPSAFFRVDNGHVSSSIGMMPDGTHDRLYLVRALGVPQFREVYDALCDMHVYQIVPNHILDVDSCEPLQRLRADGSNLCSALAVLQNLDPDGMARVQESLQTVLPTLIKVGAEPVNPLSPNNPGSLRFALVFQQNAGRGVATFFASQMSEGTLRTLAILTALYQINAGKRRPMLTAIEDVEAAVHPGALRVILDALQEASLTTQVLVATHSPELLDEKDVAAETILAVTADDGLTRIGPLAEADRTVVRDRLFTVGQLLRATRLEPGANGAAKGTETPAPHVEEAGA